MLGFEKGRGREGVAMNHQHMKAKKILLWPWVFVTAILTTHAQIVETYTFTTFGAEPSLAIGDGNASGVSDVRTLDSAIMAIESLTVSLDISGEFNGDLYAYLRHDSGFSVLLNRPGRSADAPSGYGDSGLTITLSDFALNGDIHNYRDVITPTAGSPLTGVWQPDSRNVDPSVVLDSSARTALLSAFAGLNASGDWTLFVADLQSGGTSTLNSWSLEIVPVPEPHGYAMVVGAGLLALAFLRRPGGR
jgi:subtilisin-like proprotein convertase family protein